MKASILLLLLSTLLPLSNAPELIIGEERIEPGLVLIFEGAVKDKVLPASLHLAEDQTQVHIEARANWDVVNLPKGTPAGGFVAYLDITAKVVNQKSGLSTFIDLMPHINLVDNFHYARNMTLPGDIDDKYEVTFTIIPPGQGLGLHRDWVKNYGASLFETKILTYRDIEFGEIARATRG